MEKSAIISDCGKFRYHLTRRWGEGPALGFIMLNPSTADASVDDATIRRCIGFAKRYGFNALEVANLFAYRATQPKDMLAAADPVGPENDSHIIFTARACAQVICAWGPNAARSTRPVHVMTLLAEMRIQAKCLHVTKGGHPGHPLMLSYDREPQPFGLVR